MFAEVLGQIEHSATDLDNTVLLTFNQQANLAQPRLRLRAAIHLF